MGGSTREKRQQEQLLLSPEQEQHLLDWILKQESLGYAPSHGVVRACAEELLRRSGATPEVSKNWLNRFLKCHKEVVSSKLGKRQEPQRFDSFTHKAVD